MESKNVLLAWWSKSSTIQKIIIFGFIGLIVLAIALNGGNSAENKLKECLKITGYNFSGACQMGSIVGEATITIDKDGKYASVTYSVMGSEATESGKITNLKLEKGGSENTYKIVGDWEVNGNASQGAKFYFNVFSQKPNTIICQISNSQFSYYDNIILAPDDFLRIKEILKCDQKNSDENNNKSDAPIAAAAPVESVGIKKDDVNEVLNSSKNLNSNVLVQIGVQHEGGIIIQIDNSGEHGIIMSNEDLGSGGWYNAKDLCDNYSVSGFSDWRLPTIVELRLIYKYKNLLDNFENNWYWSSSEDINNPNRDIHLGFVYGDEMFVPKEHGKYVRAVREF